MAESGLEGAHGPLVPSSTQTRPTSPTEEMWPANVAAPASPTEEVFTPNVVTLDPEEFELEGPLDEGVNGVWSLKDKTGKRWIFKPAAAEAFRIESGEEVMGHQDKMVMYDEFQKHPLKRGVRYGFSTQKEVAAYMLDHESFHGVPATYPARVFLPSSWGSSSTSDKVVKYVLHQGSLQEYQPHMDSAENVGASKFSADQVHKIGVLDVRLLNLDRHSGNILVSEPGYVLHPIDHGFSLPDFREAGDVSFEWLYWKQCKEKFSPRTLAFIKRLDPLRDAALLFRNTTLGPEAALSCLLSTTLLKVAAEKGLTLFQIGSILQRKGCGDEPSVFERLVSQTLQSMEGKWDLNAVLFTLTDSSNSAQLSLRDQSGTNVASEPLSLCDSSTANGPSGGNKSAETNKLNAFNSEVKALDYMPPPPPAIPVARSLSNEIRAAANDQRPPPIAAALAKASAEGIPSSASNCGWFAKSTERESASVSSPLAVKTLIPDASEKEARTNGIERPNDVPKIASVTGAKLRNAERKASEAGSEAGRSLSPRSSFHDGGYGSDSSVSVSPSPSPAGGSDPRREKNRKKKERRRRKAANGSTDDSSAHSASEFSFSTGTQTIATVVPMITVTAAKPGLPPPPIIVSPTNDALKPGEPSRPYSKSAPPPVPAVPVPLPDPTASAAPLIPSSLGSHTWLDRGTLVRSRSCGSYDPMGSLHEPLPLGRSRSSGSCDTVNIWKDVSKNLFDKLQAIVAEADKGGHRRTSSSLKSSMSLKSSTSSTSIHPSSHRSALPTSTTTAVTNSALLHKLSSPSTALAPSSTSVPPPSTSAPISMSSSSAKAWRSPRVAAAAAAKTVASALFGEAHHSSRVPEPPKPQVSEQKLSTSPVKAPLPEASSGRTTPSYKPSGLSVVTTTRVEKPAVPIVSPDKPTSPKPGPPSSDGPRLREAHRPSLSSSIPSLEASLTRSGSGDGAGKGGLAGAVSSFAAAAVKAVRRGSATLSSPLSGEPPVADSKRSEDSKTSGPSTPLSSPSFQPLSSPSGPGSLPFLDIHEPLTSPPSSPPVSMRVCSPPSSPPLHVPSSPPFSPPGSPPVMSPLSSPPSSPFEEKPLQLESSPANQWLQRFLTIFLGLLEAELRPMCE